MSAPAETTPAVVAPVEETKPIEAAPAAVETPKVEETPAVVNIFSFVFFFAHGLIIV